MKPALAVGSASSREGGSATLGLTPEALMQEEQWVGGRGLDQEVPWRPGGGTREGSGA